VETTQAIETWTVTKPAVSGTNGLVASQHYLASDIGARVLAEGGNAVDAALAASVAIGTVEPWMSGLGGGGYMLVYSAAEDRTQAIDFGMVAPRALDPADYPLVEGTGPDLFAWPSVVEDRNLQGPHSIAVPGFVAGLALAHERFATRSWAETLAPAIALAERGMTVDWYASFKIASDAALLTRHDESRRVYLPGGFPPVGEWGRSPPGIRLGKLAATLARLAEAGAGDFYRGEIARALVADAQALGSRLAADDLADYAAHIGPASAAAYRDATVHGAPGLTAGPTLDHALAMLASDLAPPADIDAETYAAYARALRVAYAHRFATMGDASAEGPVPTCTTHLSVVDRDGNMVALTQTLLSLFGSKVMLPETGIMMNNGIMWFDPRPGRPNSIGPGKRPLSNMCPTILARADGGRVALGASGGRRIMPAVMQLISFLVDFGMDLDAAFHTPRLDVSGGDEITLDNRVDAATVAAVAKEGPVAVEQHAVYPALFACPNAVASGSTQTGAAFVMSPWAKVSAA